jgi:hypothetical protein
MAISLRFPCHWSVIARTVTPAGAQFGGGSSAGVDVKVLEHFWKNKMIKIEKKNWKHFFH